MTTAVIYLCFILGVALGLGAFSLIDSGWRASRIALMEFVMLTPFALTAVIRVFIA